MEEMEQGERTPYADREHFKCLAISSTGYWGRGHSQEEAVKQMREAGFSGRIGKTKNKVLLFVFPPTLREPHVDGFGNVHWYDGATGDTPEKVWL
jgi:hypothetical protein